LEVNDCLLIFFLCARDYY